MSEPNDQAPDTPAPKKKYTHVFHDLSGKPEQEPNLDVDLGKDWTPPPKVEEEPAPDKTPVVDEPPPDDTPPPDKPDDRSGLPEDIARIENAELRERLAQLEGFVATRQQAEQTNALRQYEDAARADWQSMEQRLAKVRADKQSAYTEGDAAKLTALDEEMADLKADMRIKARDYQQYTQQREQLARPQQPQQPAPQAPPLAKAWVRRNAWFDDTRYYAERAFATATDAILSKEGKLSPHDGRYYEELDRRIGEKFPNLVPGARKNAPPVAPPRTAAPAPKRSNVVRLTKSDQDAMRRVRLNPDNPADVRAYALAKAAGGE